VALGLASLMLVRVLSWLALLPAPTPQRTLRSSRCDTKSPCCAAPTSPRRPTRRAWKAEQERLVRVYHEMGLNPRQIAERARESAPRLAITESLAVRILSARRR
jgi:hypothetical protein